jgi:hypothetical protein
MNLLRLTSGTRAALTQCNLCTKLRAFWTD